MAFSSLVFKKKHENTHSKIILRVFNYKRIQGTFNTSTQISADHSW